MRDPVLCARRHVKEAPEPAPVGRGTAAGRRAAHLSAMVSSMRAVANFQT